jgi:hypothetical protein
MISLLSRFFPQFPFFTHWSIPVLESPGLSSPGEQGCGTAISTKSPRHAQRKADVRFRWKTTMVHGDDKISPQTIAFMSRCLWCASLLAVVCLLASPRNLEQAESANSHFLKSGPSTLSEVHPMDEPPRTSTHVENLAHQPNSFRWAISSRLTLGDWEPGEALSEAVPGGRSTAGRAWSATRHRSTRLTGNQHPRDPFSRGPTPGDEQNPFVTRGRFHPAACFS